MVNLTTGLKDLSFLKTHTLFSKSIFAIWACEQFKLGYTLLSNHQTKENCFAVPSVHFSNPSCSFVHLEASFSPVTCCLQLVWSCLTLTNIKTHQWHIWFGAFPFKDTQVVKSFFLFSIFFSFLAILWKNAKRYSTCMSIPPQYVVFVLTAVKYFN